MMRQKGRHNIAMKVEWPYIAIRNAMKDDFERVYFLLKASKSANKVSAPVKASRTPPSDFQPSALLRTRDNALKNTAKSLSERNDRDAQGSVRLSSAYIHKPEGGRKT